MNSEVRVKLDEAFSRDCFGRKALAEKLLKIINYNCPFRDDSFVISLNAPFGRGKTTFINMFEKFLLESREVVINLNAWETDFTKDPLIAISCSMMEGIKNSNLGLDEEFKQKSTKLIKEFLKAVTTIAIPGGDKLVQVAEALANKNDDKDEQFFKTKKHYKELKDLLNELVEKTDNKRVILIVDELDRCRPNYAIEFLEAIKHIFAVRGIVFILAVNKEQIKNSANALFGEINFDNYYLRFVSKEIELTEPKIEDYHKFNITLFEKYQKNKPSTSKDLFGKTAMEVLSNGPFQDNRNPAALDQLLEWNTRIFASLKFEPRQIERFYKDFSYFIYREIDWPNGRDTSLAFTKALSLIIALRIKSEVLFNLLVSDYERFPTAFIDELKIYGLCGDISDNKKNARPYFPYNLGLEIFSFCIDEQNHVWISQLVIDNFSNKNNEESKRLAKDLFVNFKNNYTNPSFVSLALRLLELRTIEEN